MSKKSREDLIGKANAGGAGISHKNDLYRLLKRKFRHDERLVKNGRLRCPQIARLMNMTNEGVYRWLRADRVTLAGFYLFLKIFPQYLREWDLLPYLAPMDYNRLPDSVKAEPPKADDHERVHDLI